MSLGAVLHRGVWYDYVTAQPQISLHVLTASESRGPTSVTTTDSTSHSRHPQREPSTMAPTPQTEDPWSDERKSKFESYATHHLSLP